MTNLPEPLQPADVDMRGMDFMPFKIEQLRRSRAMALATSEAAAGFSMFLLWLESWWETPAGSLEDDELLLASAARCSRDDWKKRKPIALYGWVLCDDGRWYHPTICEIAWEVWTDRLKHRWQKECDRITKANKKAIADAQAEGMGRQAELKALPSREAFIRTAFPASAAKLFAPAATPTPAPSKAPAGVPAATNTAPDAGIFDQKGGAFGRKPPDFLATPPPFPAETALKDKGKDKIIPPTPLGGEAARSPEAGLDWQRADDFAEFMAAVDQPDAPTETCWRAWLDMLAGPRPLPERRLMLAMIAAWRQHCGQQAAKARRYRPLGPARLIREGVLWNFADKANRLVADQASMMMIDLAETERAARAREAWSDLYQPALAVAGSETMFNAWFGRAWPERDGDKLVIWTRSLAVRNWMRDKFAAGLAKRLACAVEVQQFFGEGAKA